MQPVTHEHVSPPSSQEIEELPRETTFEEDCATEDIPKNEEQINEFFVSYVERKHRNFWRLSTSTRKPKESLINTFALLESRSQRHDVCMVLVLNFMAMFMKSSKG
jgi:hypothetical protein